MRNQLNELRAAGENIDPSQMIEQLEVREDTPIVE